VAAEHVAKGAVLARRLIASAPDDYVGYRLAADYYRMRGNWSQFDEMLKKLETKNPTSNGLVFLRAMDEIQRAGRTASGQELLRQALQKDPKFVRAQSELVMAAGSLDERVKELKALEKLNPRHQLVLWVGPVLDAAYARDQKSKAADEPKDYDSGGPPPPT
jgi:predicted Zn-dependent protease